MLILFINKFLRLDLYWAIAVLGLNKKSLIIVMRLLYESGIPESSGEDLREVSAIFPSKLNEFRIYF